MKKRVNRIRAKDPDCGVGIIWDLDEGIIILDFSKDEILPFTNVEDRVGVRMYPGDARGFAVFLIEVLNNIERSRGLGF